MFSILASKAKTSRANKTGSWRSLKKPKYLKTNCIGCKLCKLICPEGCIEGKEKNQYDTNLDYCKGCGLCVYICPKKDIEMVDEDK
ncbi:MAG: 4Fe-4S dicluster domain-containing protein [Candidatus Omnitrophica bacterium]|nr:4Fe-4S dicluster domain-containing protein [Candidatus Omnitrophota bacterium]